MIVEAVVLGTITLNYKPPQPPPLEVGRPVSQISLVEPISTPPLQELEVIPLKPTTTVRTPVDASNTYEQGQCTWWVKQWKPEVPNSWGNANSWDENAFADGWTVSSTPIPGAIAQSDRGAYGHVALVLEIVGDTVLIQEGNYDYNGSVRTKTVPISTYQYIY